MINTTKHIVVFGAGSIGERHIKNLWNLGFRDISVFRQRNLPFRDLDGIKVRIITTWDELEFNIPFAAIICSPTSQHLLQTIKCAELGIHCLVEKPLSHNLRSFSLLLDTVKRNNVFIYVGYMMRFHPLIIKIKEIINKKKYGNLLSLNSKWGEYLPDWHPWENYKESYASKKSLGGGVALTLSHDIDIANFLINSEVVKHTKINNFKSNLGIDVESGADILIRYQDNTTANIHLNFHEKNKERFLKLVFDNASINFNYYDSELIIINSDEKDEVFIEKDFDRNNLFIAQSKYFFSKINNFTKKESIKNIQDSKLIIKICNNEL
ncbi:Gfo/Idh/MocA family oxidoreductase [Flavobacteriaceae bacterium]|nr:Gfo/Idh/MocA family oxidoreductase [Flavobacteriaceae bacterium]